MIAKTESSSAAFALLEIVFSPTAHMIHSSRILRVARIFALRLHGPSEQICSVLHGILPNNSVSHNVDSKWILGTFVPEVAVEG